MATDWTDDTASDVSGNWGRFVDADPFEDAEGGVDFHDTFTSENPFVFTADRAPVSFTSNDRNDP